MAALANPHWEAVTPELREILTLLGQLTVVRPFYLAGGTALALRLGHRASQDLGPVEWSQVKDFFLAEARRLGQKWSAQG